MKTETDDTHSCGICKTALTTLSDFLIHKLQHIGHGKGLGCELCGLGYNRASPLQDHYRRKHGLEIFAKRPLVKTAASLSKEMHKATSATTVSSSVCSSTTTTSPALKHLLSTPFIGSCRNPSLPLLPEDIVFEEKLPSASRNLQSAKDKLTAAQFSSLSNKIKLTPAESKIKSAANLILSECEAGSSDADSMDNGIDLASHDRHLSSADPNLLSADVTQMLSADTNLTSAIVNLPSADVNVISSRVTLLSSSSNTNLKSTNVNLSSADVNSSSVNVNLPSATTHLPSDVHLSSSAEYHLSSTEVPLPDGHSEENISSEVNLCDVGPADLVTSDVMFSDHSVDISSTAAPLTEENLNTVIEKSVLERSNKMPPSKTIHVVISKTGVDENCTDNDNSCSAQEMVETDPECDRAPAHPDADSCHDSVQNNIKYDGSNDIIQKTSKLQNGESCSKPDFHFILLANLVKGRVMSYRRNQFKCLHCSYKTTWINSLIKHMKTFHEDMMSIHEHIEVKSVDTNPDRRLVKMSTYNAELRNLKKNSRNKRHRGVEKQDRLGEFSCKTCDKTFNRLRYLRKHMQVHRIEKKHLCDECGKSFKTRSYLISHHRVHKTKEYRCSQCDFRSSINAVIHAHRQLHHEDSVLCDICGFAYNDKSTLKKHKLVHDPSRPHACSFPGCTWRFKSEVMCLAHVRAHTSEGKFQCSLCSYVFRQNHHLQRHIATVHGIRKSPMKGNHKKSDQTEEQEEEEEEDDDDDDSSSVRLILDYSQMDVDNFPSVLQNGQLVIATDSEGNTVNYEVADITMNVAVMPRDEDDRNQTTDGQAVLIPNYDCGQIIFQGSEMT
ncbi:zinc finger protein ZFAT-like [Gigantopelta aegis]|uniref:zinc finger protein ZFAT-like n=1 Tax=Gigantopelta aegis TaxID=1735272 RepID=UPI001B8873CD|nr:zinc finger protein ZFAT-like [Gigantopelta aegis]XP_041375768.1 zinc finger protein ZFAT-like [Gigantopelta aegis]XP_041375769.1 zinc finger protein ZFAT-like [Gigantopelta aegis]XP_041375770.1 zinc finger protein ZFAT-like [Gigantopelta aegis]